MSDPLYLPLAEAAKVIYYTASCTPCHHSWQVDLDALVETLGPDFITTGVIDRIACPKCKLRPSNLTTLFKSASTSETILAVITRR